MLKDVGEEHYDRICIADWRYKNDIMYSKINVVRYGQKQNILQLESYATLAMRLNIIKHYWKIYLKLIWMILILI
jgi:hypothetical protein